MSVKFINDWQYLFKPGPMGDRFISFTFINVAFFKDVVPEINGFTIIVLGLGFTIKPVAPVEPEEQG